MKSQVPVLASVVLVMASLVACGEQQEAPALSDTVTITETTAPAAEATPAEVVQSNAMSVDVTSGASVETSRTVTTSDPFEVDINVDSAPTPYQGYQYTLEWDPSILAYDAATELSPAEMYVCATPSPTGSTVFGGCLRTTETTTYTGPVARVTLHCVANGTSALHLRSVTEDPDFGSVTIAVGGYFIPTTATGASVTCEL